MAERKRVAPYAPASAVSEFFDHIRYVKTPDKVDSNLLLDYGISKSQTFPVLSTLRFLDIIEPDGTPTTAFRALQVGGEEFTAALRELVERGYADLFGRLDVSRDSKDKLKNYFARNYSPATAERATTLFLDLCGEAGIPTAPTPTGEGSQKRAASQGPKRQSGSRAGSSNPPPPPPPPSPPDGSRVAIELRLTEADLELMDATDIEAVFTAAAKIQVARTKALSRARNVEKEGKGE